MTTRPWKLGFDIVLLLLTLVAEGGERGEGPVGLFVASGAARGSVCKGLSSQGR